MALSKTRIKIKKAYKDQFADEWSKALGGGTFQMIEEAEDNTPVQTDNN